MLKMTKNRIADWFRRIPIGKKITVLYAGVFAVALILSSIFIFTNLWYYYRDYSKKELIDTIKKIEDFIKDDGAVTVENINALIEDKDIEARIVINSDIDGDFEINPKMNPGVGKLSEKTVLRSYKFMGEKYLYCQKTVYHRNNAYTIQAFKLYESEANMLSFLAAVFVGVNVLGIICAYLIGVLISRKFLKPVTDITETADKISISDLNLRIAVPEADDEIRTLALTFNDMIQRLEISFEGQKQFISDASHEFRTPISVIQGYANLISRWGKSDPDVLDEAIASIKSETDYMSGMINQLLYLARGENKNTEITKTVFCLNELVSETVKDFEVTETEALITFDSAGRYYICANENLIKELIHIFIENAIKYGKPEGKEINISLYGEENNIVLRIADNGIGISEEDLPRIFERFYRGDKSRNKEISGTGLGLSIAKLIVERHDGKILAESALGQGTVFRIILPQAENITDTENTDG